MPLIISKTQKVLQNICQLPQALKLKEAARINFIVFFLRTAISLYFFEVNGGHTNLFT